MELKDLKDQILNTTLANHNFIFVVPDTTSQFLCNTYIDSIANILSLKKLYIDELNYGEKDDVLFNNAESSYLYVYTTDGIKDDITDNYNNMIIICKNIDKDIDTGLFDVVNFPKITNWQIEAYVACRLPGLSENAVKWLCNISNYNIDFLANECDKLCCFNKDEQEKIFLQINADDGYSYLSQHNIFHLTNAILKKDWNTVLSVINELQAIDIEGVGLITIFSKQLRKLIDVQMSVNKTAEQLGLSSKQYYAIKQNVGVFSDMQLREMYYFIAQLDYRLKAGQLSFYNEVNKNNKKLVEYIIISLMCIANRNQRYFL